MADKKFGIGSAIALGAIAAVAVSAVASYLKREELKTLAEEVAEKLKKNGMSGAECCGGDECCECAEEPVEIVIESEEAPGNTVEKAPEDTVEIVIEATEETEEKAEEVEE